MNSNSCFKQKKEELMKKKIYNTPTVTVVTVQLASFIAESVQSVDGGPSKGVDWTEGEANSRGGSFWDDEE